MSETTSPVIEKSFADGVCILTLSRERVYNAINRQILDELIHHLEELRFLPELRVLVITGKGEKAFCSGADLKERATFNESEVKQFIYKIRNTVSLVADFPKPVIAAINGIALGGGTELALACDLRIASRNAKMGLTETKLAIIPGAGGTQRLPRIVGPAKAKELIYTGRHVLTPEALDIGLVNSVVDTEVLMEKVLEIANMIKKNGPIAIEQAKKAIDRGLEVDLNTGLAYESEAYQSCIPTEDRLEGLKAFKEKRSPNYLGK